jgi:hypothetical protein
MTFSGSSVGLHGMSQVVQKTYRRVPEHWLAAACNADCQEKSLQQTLMAQVGHPVY